MNVLITCCNSGVIPPITNLIKSSNLIGKCRLIGVDSSSLSNGLSKKYFDKAYQVPNGDSGKEYIDALVSICEKENVNVILAGSDDEALNLKQNESAFSARIIGSSFNKMALLSDKFELSTSLQENGLEVPDFFIADSLENLESKLQTLGYPNSPVLIKPRSGRGSRGLKLIMGKVDRFENFNSKVNHEIDFFELKRIFENRESELPNYLFSEYLPGDKYSADVLVDNGKVASMVLRNNGNKPKVAPPTMIADIVYDRDVIEYAKQCCECLGLDDFAQVEVGRDKNGILKLIEINGRLDATLAITTGIDLNYYELLIYKAKNGGFPKDLNIEYQGLSKRFIRYLEYDFIDIDNDEKN